MYKGNNPAALRSREEIVAAFLSLLQSAPFDEISVKQIMLETRLTRQTFYQIFSDKDEILEYYLETIFESFIRHASSCEIHTLCDAAKVFFCFFAEYKEIFALIIRNGKSCVIQRKCREFLLENQYIRYDMDGVHSEGERRLATTFVISGIVAMLEHWIRDEEMQHYGEEELARLVCRITGAKEALTSQSPSNCKKEQPE